MDQPGFYIPVDSTVPLSDIMRQTLTQMQNRSLNDPRYAGFEPGFDWHAIVTLDISDPVLRANTAEVLDQMARTPEGQHTLRQADAIHQKWLSDPEHNEGKTLPTLVIREVSGKAGTNANQQQGLININPEEIRHGTYEGMDGAFHPDSLNSALYHEFGHMKDAFLLPAYAAVRAAWEVQEKAKMDGLIHAEGLDPKKHYAESALSVGFLTATATLVEEWDSPTEYPVMHDTNAFTGPHYGEAPRGRIHNNYGHRAPLHSSTDSEFMHHEMLDSPATPTAPSTTSKQR